MGSRTLTNILLAIIALGLVGPKVPHVTQGISDWLAKAGKASAIAECHKRGYKNTVSETTGLKYCLRHLVGADKYFNWDMSIRDQI